MLIITQIFAPALLLISSVTALGITALLSSLAPASETDPRFTDFQHPGVDDIRSPCPGLNTLANHGFINRNGRNMTIPHLLEGLAAGLNIGADFTTVAGAAGLLGSPDPASGSFDLDALDRHNFPIEHDASLSRQDAYFGNDYSFYSPNWQQVLNYYDGDSFTNIPHAAAARYSRVLSSRATNPEMLYGARQFVLSYGETALYMQAMSDPITGAAPISYVRSLFEQEKLPFDLGWRPSPLPITFASLSVMAAELQAVSHETAPGDAQIGADSLLDVFVSISGGSSTFAALTAGISSALGL